MCETRARTHMCMSGTRSSGRKLQHNDKVLEHNGLSSAQTEARTSLAPKGQQASQSSCSAAPILLFAILITLRWPLCCKCGSHPEIPSKHENAIAEASGGGGVLILEGEHLLDFVSQGLVPPRIGFGVHQSSLVRCQSGGHLLPEAGFLPRWRAAGCGTECFQRAKHGRSAAKGRFWIHEAT